MLLFCVSRSSPFRTPSMTAEFMMLSGPALQIVNVAMPSSPCATVQYVLFIQHVS